MSDNFEPVPVDIDEVLKHMQPQKLSESDRSLIQQSGLPGARDMFDQSNPERARQAAKLFVQSFLMGG